MTNDVSTDDLVRAVDHLRIYSGRLPVSQYGMRKEVLELADRLADGAAHRIKDSAKSEVGRPKKR